MLKSLLVLLLAVSLNSGEFPVQIPETQSKESDKLENTASAKNTLNQALMKALEGLIPSNLKFLVKSVLANFDSEKIIKSAVHYIIPTASDNKEISQQCRKDSWLYVESLTNFTEWALKMLDASGKIPEGAFSGNYHSMGHFDQCLKVKGPEEISGPKFTGKYCTVFLKPVPVPAEESNKTSLQSKTDSVPFIINVQQIDAELLEKVNPNDLIKQLPSFAFCIPSTCSASDIQAGLADTVASIGLPVINGIKMVPFASEDFCHAAGTQRDYDTTTIIFMFVFGILAMFLVLGTAYDAYLRHKNRKHDEKLRTKQQVLLSFSVLTNGASILDTNDSTEGNLGCLHGIRFLSCFWVVVYHTFTGALQNPNANTAQFKEDQIRFFSQIVVNGPLAVDSFFFLSGLLVCYTKLRELDRSNGKLDVPLMYLNRYLRLTPLCALLLAFIATLYAHLSTGPYWGTIVMQSEACRNSWWYYLLFVNNFFNKNASVSSCLPVAWYIAVDMQLFLLSPVFIYVLWRRPKFGVALLGVAIVSFTAVTMFIIYFKSLPPTFLLTENIDPKSLLRFHSYYYEMPWCRIMPYLVGIYMGYVLHNKRKSKISMKPWLVGTGWSVAASMAFAVLFGMYEYVDSAKVPVIPQTVSVLYGSLNRTAWAVSLSWLVLACVYGYGGLVNRFLSSSIFIPLSRLTYSTYLMHGFWLGYYNGKLRKVAYYTTSDMVVSYFSNMAMSLSLAFIAALCIEVPFQNLQKIFLSPKTRSGNGNLVAGANDISKGV